MKKAIYLNGTEIPKSDPFYNVLNHKPELPKGIEYLKGKYLNIIRLGLYNPISLKEQIFNEVEAGNCEYLDAHVFCGIYLKKSENY